MRTEKQKAKRKAELRAKYRQDDQFREACAARSKAYYERIKDDPDYKKKNLLRCRIIYCRNAIEIHEEKAKRYMQELMLLRKQLAVFDKLKERLPRG